MDTDRAIQELADKAAIQEVITRYAFALDRRDPEMLASCFTSDAVFEFVGVRRTAGVDNIKWAAKRLERYSKTQHQLGTQLIQVQGDEADAETYVVAYHWGNEGGAEREVMVVGGRYVDRLVRRDGRWLIRQRTLQAIWQRGHSLLHPDPS